MEISKNQKKCLSCGNSFYPQDDHTVFSVCPFCGTNGVVGNKEFVTYSSEDIPRKK